MTEGMYEEVDDSGQCEGNMQRLVFRALFSLATLLGLV